MVCWVKKSRGGISYRVFSSIFNAVFLH